MFRFGLWNNGMCSISCYVILLLTWTSRNLVSRGPNSKTLAWDQFQACGEGTYARSQHLLGFMIKWRSIIKHVCRSYGLLWWQHQMGSYLIADDFRCYNHYVVSVQWFAVTGCAVVHVWQCMSDDDSLYSLCDPLTSTTNSFLPTLVLRSVYKYVLWFYCLFCCYTLHVFVSEKTCEQQYPKVLLIPMSLDFVFVPTHDRGNHRWALSD